MFERFTDRARAVVRGAKDEARQLGHSYICTEHLLLAIVNLDGGIAHDVLLGEGVDADSVRAAIQGEVGTEAQVLEALGEHIPYTPRSKRVLELSLRESLALNHRHIGTEHLLLALIRDGEGDGLAAKILTDLGIDLGQLRIKTVDAAPGAAW